MAHAAPVVVAPGAIRPFNVGMDPVARASQVVSTFLFARRDASPARTRINLEVRSEELLTPTNAHLGVSAELSRLALVTGFGLTYTGNLAPAGIRPPRADVTLRIGGGSRVVSDAAPSAFAESSDGTFSGADFIKGLKEKGLLPGDNRTDPEHGLFESENGQILLDARARLMTVRTPRLEGVSFDLLAKPVTTGALTVLSSTVPASVSAIALDDAPLSESRRVLLVYATDAANSGMAFDDVGRKVLRRLGDLPVLMRTGVFAIRLASRNAGDLKAWALGMDGARRTQLPARLGDGVLDLAIDTTALPGGPSPFLVIAVR